ncbi:MAG: hypothetical protein LUQ11_04010 [Methylococcaceae bacterium]|nr:hypothetical protein [Methylococcaceae bacterium]
MAQDAHADAKLPEPAFVHDAMRFIRMDIGEVVRRAYHGELEFHYNPERDLLRVLWRH